MEIKDFSTQANKTLEVIKEKLGCNAFLRLPCKFDETESFEEFLEQTVLGRFSLSGYISQDSFKRFYDGTYVTTSTVKSYEMINDKTAVVKTRNTIYFVYVEEI